MQPGLFYGRCGGCQVGCQKKAATRECESWFAQRFALKTGQLHTAMALQGGANPAPRYPIGGGSKSTTNRALDRANAIGLDTLDNQHQPGQRCGAGCIGHRQDGASSN